MDSVRPSRAWLAPTRRAAMPRAAVATAADGLKPRRPLMIEAVTGGGVRRGRPSGCEEGLQTGAESG